ncbi:unknown [Mycoplasma sp. CAG:877]|jgi:hypothetical protein|nr:unknown [Mycoplasma sp. CAG:877]
MKAATGELNLTVITLIAIAAVIGFFWVMWPNIKSAMNSQWGNISGNDPNNGIIVLERR